MSIIYRNEKKIRKKLLKKPPLRLLSPAFSHYSVIPERYTYQGENVNPPLIISHVPLECKSLLLTIEDIDAPGHHFLHWIVSGIDPNIDMIPEGSSIPGATVSRNSFTERKYCGPCPLQGVHRYYITLYALNEEIRLPEKTTMPEIMNSIRPYIIESDTLVGIVETPDEFAIE